MMLERISIEYTVQYRERVGLIADPLATARGTVTDIKLRDDFGRNLSGVGSGQTVTDGPYAETKEIIGGYWIITARDYAVAGAWLYKEAQSQ